MQDASRPHRLRWPGLIAAALLAACPAALSEPVRAEGGPGNVITVHPSAAEPRVERARTAEELLERRLKRSSELLRSICIGCGTRDPVAGAPAFNPMQALHGPNGAPSQVLIPHALPDQVIVEVRQVPIQPAPDTAADPAPPEPAPGGP